MIFITAGWGLVDNLDNDTSPILKTVKVILIWQVYNYSDQIIDKYDFQLPMLPMSKCIQQYTVNNIQLGEEQLCLGGIVGKGEIRAMKYHNVE